MRVNDKQVGGSHYKKSKFQPWDWDLYGVGGLELNIIKYVTRYKDKNGVQDLQKAQHYLEKLHEDHTMYGRNNRYGYRVNTQLMLDSYTDEWQLNITQSAIVAVAVRWRDVENLRMIAGWIQELIDGYSTSDVRPAESVVQTAATDGVVPVERR